MDIGTIVNLNIHETNKFSFVSGEYYKERIMPCIVLGSKSYSDLYTIWTIRFKYLRECYSYDGLFLYVNSQSCPADLQAPYLKEPPYDPLCYELLYGDKKVWIRSEMLLKHHREA